jgi:excisionase family DNA binding protein
MTILNKVTPALLTREQAANYLGVTTSTLAVWACTKRYDLPYVKVGRLCKYQQSILDAFIERNTIGGETLQ